MSEPKVFLTFGRFELVKRCYHTYPKQCEELATGERGGYPICDRHQRVISRCEESSDLHYKYYDQYPDATERGKVIDAILTAKYGPNWIEGN